MARSIKNVARRRRVKKIIRQAKGYRLGKKNLYRHAVEQVNRSLRYAWRDRRVKKREFRSLWIMRINAGCRANGLSYSQFIHGLKKTNVQLNRKILAELAVNDSQVFGQLARISREGLGVSAQ